MPAPLFIGAGKQGLARSRLLSLEIPQPGTSKSLFRNILAINHLNSKIWRDFFSKPMILLDREIKKIESGGGDSKG
jgi:hypothetical protein